MRIAALLMLAGVTAQVAYAQTTYPPSDTTALQTQVNAATATANTAMTKADAAIADGLTSANRQQALRIQVTPDANGRAVFVYPMAYVAGVKPAVTTTAETPIGAAYRNDASVEENTATNTQVVIIVQRVQKTTVTGVLNSVVTLISPVTTPVWINVLIRAPV